MIVTVQKLTRDWRGRVAEAAHVVAPAGIRYHHQARLPGVAIDCVGLPVCSYRHAGITLHDFTQYPASGPSTLLLEWAARSFNIYEAHETQVETADLVFLKLTHSRTPRHVGLALSPDSFMHTSEKHGRLIEGARSPWWRRVALIGKLKQELWPH